MTAVFTEKDFRQQLAALVPLVDTLRNMLGAARHAFNRHSLPQLEELARLRDSFTLDVDPFFQDVEEGLKSPSEGAKVWLLRLQGILTHLELMAENIGDLADPIRRKITANVILGDKDLIFINDLFSRHTGLMRGLADIFAKDNAALRQYISGVCDKGIEECFAAAKDHESRMMDTLGQMHGWSIFLSMMDHARVVLRHLKDSVTILEL